jgi:hypothetical protein
MRETKKVVEVATVATATENGGVIVNYSPVLSKKDVVKIQEEYMYDHDARIVEKYVDKNKTSAKTETYTVSQVVTGEVKCIPSKCQREECASLNAKIGIIFALLMGSGIGVISASRIKGKLHVFDGIQRITAILSFVQDMFAISVKSIDFSAYGEVDEALIEAIDGKKFSELSAGLKWRLLSRNLIFSITENLDEAGQAAMYQIINSNATPLSKIEIAKAAISPRIWDRVNEIREEDAFCNNAKVGKRFLREKQILALFMWSTGEEMTKRTIESAVDWSKAHEELSDEELTKMFENFMIKKMMFNNSGLLELTKVKKQGVKIRARYSFFDEQVLFYLFLRKCVDGKKVDKDVVKKISRNAKKIFEEHYAVCLPGFSRSYQTCATNGTDSPANIRMAANIIWNGIPEEV